MMCDPVEVEGNVRDQMGEMLNLARRKGSPVQAAWHGQMATNELLRAIYNEMRAIRSDLEELKKAAAKDA